LSKTYSDLTGSDGTISIWYKGNRYGYAQKAVYSPILDRYINEYTKPEDIKLYMYSEDTPYPMTLGEFSTTWGAHAVENIHVVDKRINLPEAPEISIEQFDENGEMVGAIIHFYFIKETEEFSFYEDGIWIDINTALNDLPYYGFINNKNEIKEYGFYYCYEPKNYNDENPIYNTIYETKNENAKYYGFVDNEYKSPTLITNLVSNTEFKSTSGWIGASTTGTSADKAIVENVYGRFDGDNFISSMDDLKNGVTDQYDNYVAYMRITLPNAKSIVFNDGIYDNRKSIGNMEENTKWAFRIKCKENAIPTIDFGEYGYNDGAYNKTDGLFAFKTGVTPENNKYAVYTVDKGYSSDTTFTENSHIRIALSG
jgi:hypothetical protein